MTLTTSKPTVRQRREQLQELAPSAKLVYKTLEYRAPEAMTQTDLATETRLSVRTVRYAIGNLEEIGAVAEERDLLDARRKLYRLNR